MRRSRTWPPSSAISPAISAIRATLPSGATCSTPSMRRRPMRRPTMATSPSSPTSAGSARRWTRPSSTTRSPAGTSSSSSRPTSSRNMRSSSAAISAARRRRRRPIPRAPASSAASGRRLATRFPSSVRSAALSGLCSAPAWADCYQQSRRIFSGYPRRSSTMSGIKDYSTTPASNTALFPEGMAPSAVNDGMRQVQADIRSWYNDSQWAIYGDGDGAFAIAYVSPTSFSVTGADVTAVYHAGRRVRAVGLLTGTIYGTIQSVAFATNTTVTVQWDAGSLQNEALTIAIGILSATNTAIPPAGAGAPGAVQLATQVETEGGTSTAKAVTPGGLAPAAMTWTGTHIFQSADAGAGEIIA